MENSYKFFENKDCKYYPCHKGLDKINCLFCYCPLYTLGKACGGRYQYEENAEGTAIPGATEAAYITGAMERPMNYYCEVTDDYGSNSINIPFHVRIDNHLEMWYVSYSPVAVEPGQTATHINWEQQT